MAQAYSLTKAAKTYLNDLINFAKEEKLPELLVKGGKTSLIYHNCAIIAEPYNNAEEILLVLKDFELSIPLTDKSIAELFRTIAIDKNETEVKVEQDGLFTYYIITTDDGFIFKLLKHTPLDVIFDEPEKVKFDDSKLELIFSIKSDDLLAMTSWLNRLKFTDIQINLDAVDNKHIKLVVTRDTSTALTIEKVFPAKINKKTFDQVNKKILVIPKEVFNYIPHSLQVYKVTDRDDELVIRVSGAYKSTVKFEKELVIKLEQFNTEEEPSATNQPSANDFGQEVIDNVLDLINDELT